MPKVDDSLFIMKTGEIMDPTQTLKALRHVGAKAALLVLMGDRERALRLLCVMNEGFNTLDEWIVDGRELPDQWKPKPTPEDETVLNDNTKCAQCGSTRRVHIKFDVPHEFKEGTRNV